MTPHALTLYPSDRSTPAMADLLTMTSALAALPDAHLLVPFDHPAWPEVATFSSGLVSRYGRKPLWTCHALARAATRLPGLNLPWTVGDGHFHMPGQMHSWIEHQGEDLHLLIDVYPIATFGGPAMHDMAGPHRQLYIRKPFDPVEVAVFDAEAEVALQVIGALPEDKNAKS